MSRFFFGIHLTRVVLLFAGEKKRRARKRIHSAETRRIREVTFGAGILNEDVGL